MKWEILKPWLAQAARDGLRTIGTALMSYGVIKDGAGLNAFIGAGMTLAGLAWGWWTTGGAEQMAGLLKKLTATATHADAVKAAQVLPPSAAVDTSIKATSVASVVAKILLIAFLPLAVLASGKAEAAQLPRPRPPVVTGDPIADIKTDLGITPAAGVTKASDGTVTCNFNVFANLNPKNLIATIQACVSDANSTFEPDVAAALSSAQAYSGSGDQTAIQCLQPALAIVQAGIQRPAVDAVAAQPATATTAAIAAVAAVPAYKPGAITLFQKFREFTLAGGPTACQNWVNGTIQGAVSPAIGTVAGVAGAAALGGL